MIANLNVHIVEEKVEHFRNVCVYVCACVCVCVCVCVCACACVCACISDQYMDILR